MSHPFLLEIGPPDKPVSRDLDNASLLVACAGADQEAMTRIYDAYIGLTKGVVNKTLRDPAQSEEVAQEVMAEVWRTADRFDPGRGSVQTWILTIAHRRAVDRVRSVQASRDRDQRIGRREHVGLYDEVAELVETRFEHQRVRDALDQLTDLEREAVELAYHCGYTHREVAQLLDTPLGTVKTRIRKGLIRLTNVLDSQAA